MHNLIDFRFDEFPVYVHPTGRPAGFLDGHAVLEYLGAGQFEVWKISLDGASNEPPVPFEREDDPTLWDRIALWIEKSPGAAAAVAEWCEQQKEAA